MRACRFVIALFAWQAALAAVAAQAVPAVLPSSEQRLPNGQQLLVLCYHDVVTTRGEGADPLSVDAATLAAHLNWLRSEGYQPIDLDALMAAYAGARRLPERAVLLTFDDGYLSLYTQVFPLLRAFRFPAVAALVGRWMEIPAGQAVPYSEDAQRPREQFISWGQAREMQSSGLIEFASHSWDLHQGIAGNPAGSLEPAATTRAFLPGRGYETDSDWAERIRSDLQRNSALLAQQLGRHPRAIVWPYGRYNARSEQIARELGMPIGLTLDSGPPERASPIGRIRRLLVDGNPATIPFARLVRTQEPAPTIHFVQLELDRLADSGGAELDRRLKELLEQIRRLGVETVVLAAFADPGPSGRIESVYFPNRHLPVRADLMNRVAWAIATSTQARVYAWLPLDGFALDSAAGDFHAQIGDLFEDLGRAAYLQGLLLGSRTAGDSLEAVSAQAAAVAERTRAWQPQLRTALKLTTAQGNPRPEQIARVLDQHEYLQADLDADRGPHGDGRLIATLRSMPGVPARTLIGLAAPSGAAANAGTHAQALQRDGFPNVGVFGADLNASATEFAELRRTLSLRAQPAIPARRGG
ncbi:MAG TPA: poly-beta-1,6-N-acetyl-D-glucosamine N-deacetylase PgaB [Burkholderiaceae bacterium]|jgi:peptidoglycan/xylan/chitin deacetylase (PgdA/CDA1 family)|nr:poly-beta-1,6-N-acetyl-D-glucosamine N-deacetylase PgaB [Burkholderiaceae bacterium]